MSILPVILFLFDKKCFKHTDFPVFLVHLARKLGKELNFIMSW